MTEAQPIVTAHECLIIDGPPVAYFYAGDPRDEQPVYYQHFAVPVFMPLHPGLVKAHKAIGRFLDALAAQSEVILFRRRPVLLWDWTEGEANPDREPGLEEAYSGKAEMLIRFRLQTLPALSREELLAVAQRSIEGVRVE